jgi:hypothetical protein
MPPLTRVKHSTPPMLSTKRRDSATAIKWCCKYNSCSCTARATARRDNKCPSQHRTAATRPRVRCTSSMPKSSKWPVTCSSSTTCCSSPSRARRAAADCSTSSKNSSPSLTARSSPISPPHVRDRYWHSHPSLLTRDFAAGFALTIANKTYVLQASSEKQKQEWTINISTLINAELQREIQAMQHRALVQQRSAHSSRSSSLEKEKRK